MSTMLTTAGERANQWFGALMSKGIDLTDNAHLKVEHEAIEFADDPSLEEAADVFISLLGAMYHRGWTLRDLAEAVHLKMDINELRTWIKQADGTYQHA